MDLDKVYELISNIPVTEQNEELLEEIKNDLAKGEYKAAMEKLQKIREMENSEDAVKNLSTNEIPEDFLKTAKSP